MYSDPLKWLLCSLVLATYALGQTPHPKEKEQVNTILALENMWNQGQLIRDARALQLLVGEHFIDTEWDGPSAIATSFWRISEIPSLGPV
jgi:hypothetical protein